MGKIVRWWPVVIWMAMIWWLSDQPDLSSGLKQDFILRKMAHVLEYGVLTWLLVRALAVDVRRVGYTMVVVIIVLGYAAVDEWHQIWVAGRSGSGRDVLVDAVGILLVWGFLSATKKRR